MKDVKVKRDAEIESDHYLAIVEIMTQTEIESSEKRWITKEKIRSYKLKEDVLKTEYQQRIRELYKTNNNSNAGVEEKWNVFKENIQKAARESCLTTNITNTFTKKIEIQCKIKQKKDM